jgi:membrane-bound metal-dependent hydrolase YbcI (DUF457 family)
MQLLSLWSFGVVAVVTIILFGASYLAGRKVRQFWAWATGTEPPKEKVAVFLPLSLLVGLLVSGFVQSFFDAGSMCHQYQQPLIPCTFKALNQHSA